MRAFFVVVSLFLSTSIFGQPSVEPEEKPKATETIVVTATRSEREASELPVSTTVIPEKQLRSTPAVYVDDVLRTIPGVQLPLANSPILAILGSRVSMRGLGDISALVLVDGIPLHDLYDGSLLWGKVPLESVRQVEVVRGAGASLFGNYALGGVISLLTHPVADDAIHADLSWGSYQTGRALLAVDRRVFPGLNVRLSDTRHDTNGYHRVPNPGPVDERTWNDTATTELRTDWDPSERTHGYLKSSWSEIGISQGSPLGQSRRDVFEIAGSLQRTVSDRALLSGALFHRRSKEHVSFAFTNEARTFEALSTDATVPTKATGGSLEWSLQREGVLPFVSFGVDLMDVRLTGEERDTFALTGALVRHDRVEGRQLSSGVFAQTSWRPGHRVEVLASARIDHFKNTDGMDAITGGTVTVFPSKTSTRFDPRISMRYAVGERTALRASVYRGFKAPALRVLYRNAQIGPIAILGNPNLEPQTLEGGEVGFDHAFRRGRIEVNLYQSNLEKFQVRAPAPGQGPNVDTFLNLGEIRARGLEVMGSLQLSPEWSLDAGYTWADSIITDDPQPTIKGNRVPETPEHYGTLGLRLLRDSGLTVQVRGRVVSSTYSDPRNIMAAPAHNVVDLFVSRPIRPWLDGYLRVENAADERYVYFVNTISPRNAAPRIVTAGVRVRLPGSRTRG